MVLGVEDEGGAAAPGLSSGDGAEAAGRPALDGADGRVGRDLVVVKLRQSRGQVVSVHLLVGGALGDLLPVVGRGWWRGDEEELAGVWQGEVGVLWGGVDGGVLAKVDAAPLAEDGLAVPDGADGNSVRYRVEGDEDAAEGLERSPGVDHGGLGDQALDGLQVVGLEGGEVLEVGNEEGVCCGRWWLQGWQVGEVEGE